MVAFDYSWLLIPGNLLSLRRPLRADGLLFTAGVQATALTAQPAYITNVRHGHPVKAVGGGCRVAFGHAAKCGHGTLLKRASIVTALRQNGKLQSRFFVPRAKP